MDKTPKELGFRMPAEWEKHSLVWLAWPYDDTTFPGLIPDVERSYCEIIKALEGSEKVNLIVKDEDKVRVENFLKRNNINLNNVEIFIAPYADVWTRDYMPISIYNDDNEVSYVKWNYNAYGKGYEDPIFFDLLRDNDVSSYVLSSEKNKIWEPGIVLEGGAIESNGNGTIMTTEQCLLNTNRNGDLSKEDNEKYLKDYLGAENIIWLKNGLVNDHTDGHIDEIARFVAPNKIICAYEEDVNDPNFQILENNFKILENSVDKDGNKFEIIKLPMPHMNYNDGKKAPVSYTNFYISNSVIVMSIFNDPNDEKAENILQSIFPDKRIIKIDCSKIIYGGGALHCMTMQQINGINNK